MGPPSREDIHHLYLIFLCNFKPDNAMKPPKGKILMDKLKDSIIHVLNQQKNRAISKSELAAHLKSFRPKRLKQALSELIRENNNVLNLGRFIVLKEHLSRITGTFWAHPDGYGFVATERENDIYIRHENVTGAMHGDTIEVLFFDNSPEEKAEGFVETIVKRNKSTLIGKFNRKKERTFITPTETRNFYTFVVSPTKCLNAQDGDLVKANITNYPTPRCKPEAEITDIIGSLVDPRIDTKLIIEEFGFEQSFPKQLDKELKKLPSKIDQKEIKRRIDLRNQLTVTIDGETARDFDDAVSIAMDGENFRLWVHIADVAHYIKPKTLLNEVALQRGTSVYFPDMVIPMLPERISNELCSLNPDTDKLTLTIEMLFSHNGEKLEYNIYESVIKSNERMTYTDVKAILDGKDKKLLQRYDYLVETFHLMKNLCEKMQKTRTRRGSIDFDLPEPLIILDVTGRIIDVVNEERNIAHMLIEAFMISANTSVTEFAIEKEMPFIYRVHREPENSRIEEFKEFVSKFGLTLKKKKKVQPKHIQEVLQQAKGMVFERLINHVVLRCMTQAYYSPENKGHFGLALQDYCHFTSPIRRLPDLINHRLIKEQLNNKIKNKQEQNSLEALTKAASQKERIAMDAERKAIDIKKVRFMEDKVGNHYFGFISGLTGYGMFVELENIFVEGLVSLASIENDYYIFHEKDHTITGKSTGNQFMVGDRVEVKVKKVNLQKRQIDFQLILSKKLKKKIKRARTSS